MVAVVTSWLGENSHHFTGLNPWLVHIGWENVGTLVKPSKGTMSPMHHHKIIQLGQQNALCRLQYLQWHLSHRTLRINSVGLILWPVLARISHLQTCTSVWTSCMYHLKGSRCRQSSGALLSGFWLFWLGCSWQQTCHVPYHHWRWQRIQWCYYQSMRTHTHFMLYWNNYFL